MLCGQSNLQNGAGGMIRNWASAIAGLSVLLLASSAQSSGCCDETPRWTVANAVFTGYDNSVVAVPGNDTRVNLLLLLTDARGATAFTPPPAMAASESSTRVPAPFFQWSGFRSDGETVPNSLNCPNRAASREFQAALSAEGRIPMGERRALVSARQAMETDCLSSEAAKPIDTSGIGQSEFAGYLRGAMAFYAGNFAAAGTDFADLGSAKNGWVKETALYMVARAALNRAQTTAFDDYGSLAEPAKRDQTAIAAAGKAFGDYVRAYPAGRYADSARGLMRRVYWLAGDRAKLAGEYAKLFAVTDAARRGIDDLTLAEEIDNKLLIGQTDSASDAPALLAVVDLMRMRGSNPLYGSDTSDKPIELAEIEGQRAKFASDKPLFDYVLASHAFYVGKRPAEVLRLIPDAARQPRFTNVQFSRQMLRGFALEATRDGNTRGFWIELIGGAEAGYQRTAVELALAMHEERTGGMARVFAPDSRVRNANIRGILLGYGAGPDILRQQAASQSVPQAERDTALFTLLSKQLGRGLYAGFLGDIRLVRPSAPAENGSFQALDFRSPLYGAPPPLPLGLFTAARGYGEIGCAPLRDTVATLAKAPRASRPLLCLAEFFRVAGFDHFMLDAQLPKDELGGAPSLFPGKPFSRLETYKAIIADTAAPPDDKAYALYRAVRCYAPSGNNDCGGIEVDVAQRKAWFLRLKRDYPKSKWAVSNSYW